MSGASSSITVPLPASHEFVVHLISGLLLVTGVLWIFQLFSCFRNFVMRFEIKEAIIDDILFGFIFLTLSYALGHIISSLSAILMQKELDRRYHRPYAYYLCEKQQKIKTDDTSFSFFLFFIFCFPIWIFVSQANSTIKKTYYDDWLKNFLQHWGKIIENPKKWAVLEKSLENFQDRYRKVTLFHYLESKAKSNFKHHAEIIYVHDIRYSFARNISFCLSLLFFFCSSKSCFSALVVCLQTHLFAL